MPGIGQVQKLNMNYIFFPPRNGFVQQSQSSWTGFSVAALRLPLKIQTLIGNVGHKRRKHIDAYNFDVLRNPYTNVFL
jgi:hypothetical protein